MFEKLKKLKDYKYILYGTYLLILWFILYNYKVVLSCLNYTINLFMPFFIALVIAFIFNIMMVPIEEFLNKFIHKKSILRTLSILSTCIIFGIILIFLFSIIVPRLIQSFYLILNNALEYSDSLIVNINKILKDLNLSYRLDASNFMNNLNEDYIQEFLNTHSSNGLNILNQSLGFFSIFVTMIISFVMSLYLLANKETHLLQIRKLTVYLFGKDSSKTLFELAAETNYYFKGFVTGQLVDMVIFGMMIYIVFSFFSLPFPELMGILVGFCSLIPMFGCYISFIINLIIVIALAPEKLIIYVVGFVVIQQLEANVLYPKVVGKAVGLSGLYVIIALSVFSKLFGFFGLLIAVPLMALIYATASRIINITLIRQRIDVTLDSIDEFDNIDDDIPYTYRGH